MRTETIFCMTAALLIASRVSAETTVDASHPFAYAANAGWLSVGGDTTHGVQLGVTYCSGYMWSATCGWIGFGNGPANGWNYTNGSTADWGVNHDGQGRLTGYAYGANIGWVTFEQTYGKPCVDLLTGIMSGAAWSPNIGWISFSNTVAHVRMARLETGPDTDADGISDAWEYRYAGNLTTLHGGTADADADGATDADEFLADTHPKDNGALLRVTDFSRSGTSDRVEWTSQTTRLYRLQQTESLGANANWTDCGAGLMSGDATGLMSRQIAVPAVSKRFYRIKALLPFSE